MFEEMTGQRGEERIQAWMMSDLFPHLTTGNVCKKSPPKTVGITPKGSEHSCRSCNSQWIAVAYVIDTPADAENLQ